MTGGLRFAMVTTFYPPYHFGGDGEAVRRLAHALARRGHQVDVIHDVDAFRMLSDGAEREPLGEPDGVRVHGLRSSLGSLSCLATQQLGRPLVHGSRIRSILHRGFDVIHFHNISLVGGPGILSYGAGIKLYTAHEHWLVCPTHVLWRHNREVCTGRECLRCVLHHRRPPQLWRSTSLLERQSEHVDAFLTLSEFSAKKHAEFGFDRPLAVVPPFLAEADAAPQASPATATQHVPPYFLFVGRLETIKGIQDVIPLFARDGATEIWIAGSGSYEPQLRQLAGSGRRVRFLGQQTADQLRQLYRDAIAVVVPSVCYEVFPMVVLEAFREGTPIVARHLGPFPEIVERSAGGLLFTTTEELDTALSSLAADRRLRDNLGQAAARAFKALWSEPVAMESYFGVIRDIARRRHLDQILQRA
ncbi:MAG: glycosyltransferase family 4 protein [Vicinamibacterales bacterium]